MKWARVKPEGSVIDPYLKLSDAKSYKDFAKEDHIRKFFDHPSHLWVHHEFYFPFADEKKYSRFQKRYEIFCGGYLYFYDERVRSGVIDHAMYFKWSAFKSSGKHAVTIYLSPAPLRKKLTITGYESRLPELVAEETMNKKGNGTSTQLLQQAQTISAVARDESDEAIDPPPTPPPPPPSMGDD